MRSVGYATLLSTFAVLFPASAQQPSLTPQTEATFLAQRIGDFEEGTFDSVRATLLAAHKVAIRTSSDRIRQTAIEPTFPSFYVPTWKEVFAMIGWQTRSTWNYDRETGSRVFHDEAPPLPYRIRLAEGWKAEHHPIEVVYRPPKLAAVGMDIYWLGSYSTDQPDGGAMFQRVREDLAMHFVQGYVDGVRPAMMKLTNVGKTEALYFTTLSERGLVWRQWVMLAKGQALAIVSAIQPEHEKDLLPDVLSMVNSFEIAESRTGAPAREESAAEARLPMLRVSLGVAMRQQSPSFAGYLAILVDARQWKSLAADEDLGPFLQFESPQQDRRAMILLPKGAGTIYCVYFEGERPAGMVSLPSRRAGGTLDATHVKAAYQAVTPQTAIARVEQVEFGVGTINADDGTPVEALQIRSVNGK
jgi:hypothetical protein